MLIDMKFLSEFIDDMPVGVATADMNDNTISKYNKFFVDTFGWTLEDIDTIDKWFLNAYPNEEYRNKVVSEWTVLIEETEKQQFSYSNPMEVNISCKDGSVKVCELRYFRKENFMYGIFVDITERKNLEKKLYLLSLVDELTQLNNRKSYNQTIHKLLSQYKRSKTPFSIIMYDIDNFKLINDTFGHSVGDKVLVDMSNLIKSHIRDNDYIFRIGGEEFIILLTETPLEKGKLVSEKIRSSVENDLKAIDNKTITISIGITDVKEDDNQDKLFLRVDNSLYLSKRNGKNRVSCIG